jgi:hypothetical protein
VTGPLVPSGEWLLWPCASASLLAKVPLMGPRGRTDQRRSREEAGLMPGFQLDQALDSFAAVAPIGADLESLQFALPE